MREKQTSSEGEDPVPILVGWGKIGISFFFFKEIIIRVRKPKEEIFILKQSLFILLKS
jgi:hypothetical protein